MLSRETERKVQQHLRLAQGLIDTAVIGDESSEFEQRNALSRAYYAMFHACCSWLALKVGIVRKLGHGELLDEMRRRRGKDFGDLVRDMRGIRRAADYREDWRPQRRVTADRLRKAGAEILHLSQEIQAALE